MADGTPSYRGVTDAAKTPAPSGGGGEGPWAWDDFCGFVEIPGTSGQRWFVWTDDSASVTSGPGFLNTIVPGSLSVLTFSGTGTVRIDASSAGILAHRPSGTVTTSECG